MAAVDILKHKGEFFKVLSGTEKSQIAAMTLKPGQDSGPEEIHDGDQVLYVIEGSGEIEIDHQRSPILAGQAVIIPAKSQHHVYNISDGDFFCINVYAPPSY